MEQIMDTYDIELTLLAVMFKDDKLEFVKLDKLSEELFEFKLHKEMFKKIYALRIKKEPFDMTLGFNDYFTPEEFKWLMPYTSSDNSVANFSRYYNILLNNFRKRKVMELSSDKITVDQYEESMNKYSKVNYDIKIFNTKTDMPEYIRECGKILDGAYKTYKLGIKEIDDIVGDIFEGTMMVVGGRTSTGKSWMLLQLAYNLACQGYNILYFSCEMSKIKLLNRMVQTITGTRIESGIKKDLIKDKKHEDIIRAWNLIADKNITIVSISKFDERFINNMIDSTKAKVVIVDHIQSFSVSNKAETRAAAFSDIANNLKGMAEKQEILLIAASQQNRAGAMGDLDSLKESGGISEATDVAIMLEKINDTYSETNKTINYDIHISKNRNGMTGIAEMNFSYIYGKYIPRVI
jgi:replicative DNA helicase